MLLSWLRVFAFALRTDRLVYQLFEIPHMRGFTWVYDECSVYSVREQGIALVNHNFTGILPCLTSRVHWPNKASSVLLADTMVFPKMDELQGELPNRRFLCL